MRVDRLTPEERVWSDASDSYKLTILRREVDALQIVVSALIWIITGGIILFAGAGFILFWFVRRG